MNYEQALKEAKKVGACHAEGDALLAQTCWVLSKAHAVNPEMLYNGCRALKIDSKEIVKMSVENVGEFAFVQFAEEKNEYV